ncbi:MAG TPA: hypothetical protein GXX69_01635 [Firmicutes bacterium]|nr:hypothetical protein [Bacillota bacterium]
MKLRLVGGLILVFATGNLGFAVARRLRERVALLIRLQGLLQFLITEIDFAVTLFPEALIKVGESLGSDVNMFCNQVVKSLDLGLPLSAAWEHGLTSLVNDSPLQPGDIRPLLTLAPIIGLTDSKDQLRHLKLAQEHLRQRQLEAEQEADKNQKLWCYLGVLSGLVTVLILI